MAAGISKPPVLIPVPQFPTQERTHCQGWLGNTTETAGGWPLQDSLFISVGAPAPVRLSRLTSTASLLTVCSKNQQPGYHLGVCLSGPTSAFLNCNLHAQGALRSLRSPAPQYYFACASFYLANKWLPHYPSPHKTPASWGGKQHE